MKFCCKPAFKTTKRLRGRVHDRVKVGFKTTEGSKSDQGQGLGGFLKLTFVLTIIIIILIIIIITIMMIRIIIRIIIIIIIIIKIRVVVFYNQDLGLKLAAAALLMQPYY